MSRHDKRLILSAVILTLGIYLAFGAATSFGASVNKTISATTSSRLDSIKVYLYDDGVITADSFKLESTSGDTTVVLDDASDWDILYKFYWDGTGVPYPEWEFVKYTAGAATVDTSVIKTLASNNPSIFYGPTASGSGSDTVVIYAVDSSGTDTAVADVKLTVKNAAGSNVAIATTNGTGNYTFYLDPATYTVVGRRIGYIWNSTSLVVSGNEDSTTITGYNTPLSAPSDTGACLVYGYVYGSEPYALVTMTLPSNAYDSCNNTIIPNKIFIDPRTDENGRFEITVPKSSCLNRTRDGDLMEYTITVEFNGEKTVDHKFSIPADSSTYYLVF